MSEDYSMVFDDTSSASGDEDISDDNSDSAYLPNVLSPIQVRPEEEDEAEGSEADPIRPTAPAEGSCVDDNSKGANDGHDDAGIVEAVDALLKMHPLPSTSKKEKETSKRQGQDQKKGNDETIVDEWRNATDAKSGRTYYYNRRTRETRWKLPTNAIFVPRKEKAKESSEKSSESLVSPTETSSAKDVGTTASKQHLQLQAQHEARRGRPTEDKTIENVCAQVLPNQTNSTSPPGAGRQAICSPPEVRRIDGPPSTTRLEDNVLFGPATTTSSSAVRSPLSSNAVVVSTPAPGTAFTSSSAQTPTYCQPHYHLTSNQRQNADDHPIFCVYCASSCSSIDGLADHLLECQAYMFMLAKHPRAQRRLEDMMLRTWGVRREIPIPSAEDSFDARLISHSHIGVADSVATPSIAEHLMNDTTGSTSRSSTSIHCWDRTPPSAMTARPITASTMSSANTVPLTEYNVGISEKYDDTAASSSSSPLRECAFCGRAVENLSKHLLRCKTRQRTQERRRKASAMAMALGSSHMPGSTAAAAATTTAIQRVMSGGRSLPGHPRTIDKRIDHARRLDYY